jgi:hypothetical protein
MWKNAHSYNLRVKKRECDVYTHFWSNDFTVSQVIADFKLNVGGNRLLLDPSKLPDYLIDTLQTLDQEKTMHLEASRLSMISVFLQLAVGKFPPGERALSIREQRWANSLSSSFGYK